MIYSLLIIFFAFLICYQLYIEISKSYLIEGMTTTDDSSKISYKDYNSSDSATNALILAQQNAGNISFLKTQVDDLQALKSQVDTLNSEVATMSTQLSDLAQQQADYATSLVGSSPTTITGTGTETDTTTTPV
jgi:uncharacterized protein YoxC